LAQHPHITQNAHGRDFESAFAGYQLTYYPSLKG